MSTIKNIDMIHKDAYKSINPSQLPESFVCENWWYCSLLNSSQNVFNQHHFFFFLHIVVRGLEQQIFRILGLNFKNANSWKCVYIQSMGTCKEQTTWSCQFKTYQNLRNSEISQFANLLANCSENFTVLFLEFYSGEIRGQRGGGQALWPPA